MEEQEKCGNCRFWFRDPQPPGYELCRRFPDYTSRAEHEWCGEWAEIRVQPERVGGLEGQEAENNQQFLQRPTEQDYRDHLADAVLQKQLRRRRGKKK